VAALTLNSQCESAYEQWLLLHYMRIVGDVRLREAAIT
jgi:hypothetical protein